MARQDLQPNDRIGDLRIISAMGPSGQAQTYIALADVQAVLFEPHAKVVIKSVSTQNSAVLLFDELRHLQHLQRQTLHPNVLHIYDWADGKIHPNVRAGMPNNAVGTKSAADINNLGVRCIAFEHLTGGSLADVLRLQPSKRLPLARAAKIGRELLHALSFIHQNGVIHLDIKPEHVLFRQQPKARWKWWADVEEEAVLIDFGIARSVKDQMVLAAGQGTEQYASPEQFAEAYSGSSAMRQSQVNPASDVFTWGVLMYECLTGRNPHANASGQFDPALLNDPNFVPVVPSQLNPKVPPLVDQVIMKALSHVWQRRCQAAYDMLPEWENAVRSIRQPIASGTLRLLGAGLASIILLFGCVVIGFALLLSQGVGLPSWLGTTGLLAQTPTPTSTVTPVPTPRPSASPTRLIEVATRSPTPRPSASPTRLIEVATRSPTPTVTPTQRPTSTSAPTPRSISTLSP